MAAGDRVGLVLAGGGARGAYEVGALSVLLPHLERRGERPSLFVGTSVGAINAVFAAGSRHLPAEEATLAHLERWREVDKDRVMRPLLPWQLPLTLLRYVGEILALPGLRLPSLLDPAPLGVNLRRWIDWPAVHLNVREGSVASVAIVATAARTGRSVAFVEGALEGERHASHLVEYVPAVLDETHVRASAAIPILFPPIRVETPVEARGWYVDGGTRLNTPIKPALDLGVDRLVVIATDSIGEPDTHPGRHDADAPDLADGALHVLQGALVDPLIEDMRMLGEVNAFFADGEAAPAGRRYREVRGKPPYREVPYLLVGPGRRGAVGELAARVFRDRYGGLKALRSPDFPFLNRLLGGDSAAHGELLSYLFFDPEFVEALIAMGRDDARRWLEAPPGPDAPWQTEPLDAFTRGRDGAARSAEREA